MTTRRRFLAQTVAASALTPNLVWGQRTGSGTMQQVADGSNVAATVNPIASEAAASIMQRGGNAIDAAVAAALTLSVVDGYNSGIGGGCLMLIRLADGAVHAIDGREKAPLTATQDMFLRQGVADVKLSQDGALACGVPGEIAALYSAHQRFGKLPWKELFAPAIRAASEGHPMARGVQAAIVAEQDILRKFPASAAVFFQSDGSLYREGEMWIQKDLAKTLESIASHGPDWFYQGEFAKRTVKHLREHGGMLTERDFAEYRAVDRAPLKTNYRGHTVLGFPTPSSGGIHIQQMLQILSHYPLQSFYHEGNGVRFYHVLAEAMKLAFADRAFYLGDSDFVEIPSFLTDPSYTDQMQQKIDLDRASQVASHFSAPGILNNHEKKHTTHLTTADAFGNCVAMTATVNTNWGNKMVVPGTGVVLNNEMDDFSISPGVPNAFGLVGSAANAVQGGKRPLSSMSPTIVLAGDGNLRFSCGAAGGPRIINATLQNLVRVLDLDSTIDEAIVASRLHHQWQPDILYCESSLGGPFRSSSLSNANPESSSDNSLIESLRKLGHRVEISRSLAVAQGIEHGPKGGIAGIWRGACDPRANGRVAVSS